MKKTLLILIGFGVLFANEVDYTKNLSFDIRATYVNYDYDKGFPDAEAFASSLKVKYEQKLFQALRAGAAFATVQDLGIMNYAKSEKRRDMAYIFNKDKENFSILHQLYLQYNYSKNLIEIGRFELETPLISSSDYFLLSNTFEGVHIDIKELDDSILRAGYISKMSGAWDSAYDGGAFESMTKQTWAHRGDTGNERYYNLVNDLGVNDDAMAYLGVEYTKDTLQIQFYDYILFDAYNALFTQIDYVTKVDKRELLLAGQYIQYDGVGALKNSPNPDAEVDYATYSAKAQIADKRWKVKLAYTGVTDTPSIHFFGSAGGFPQFASGMMISYFSTSLRDANIYSITPSINFGTTKHTFNFTTLYAYYDLNSDYTKGGYIGDAIKGDEYMHAYGVSAEYTYNKNLSWNIKLAQRELESSDKNLLFRTTLKYTF